MTSITAGATGVTLYVYFVDDDGGTAPGEPTTGLLFSDIETGGSASYVRQGAARTDFTLQTLASASAAWATGGFILVDDTNMPGLYRVDVPDAAFAAGADFVIIQMVAAGANNTLMRPLLVMLPDVDFGDTVRAGLTALPNAAADGAFGLPISDAGGLDLDAKLANTNEITAARMAELDPANLPADVDAVLLDTGTTIPGTIATLQGDTDDIQTRLPAALVNSRMDSNVSAIAGVVQSATNLEASTDTIASGTASGTPTTTTMISDIAITDDDQFNGKTIIFASDTTTAGLRKQATDITACTAATNTLTFTALTQAPVSGDTFSIV